MKRFKLLIFMFLISLFGAQVVAQRFGKVDNLFEYIVKGQVEKFDKNRQSMKPKDLDPFKIEVDYADNLKKVLFESVEDYNESLFKSYVAVCASSSKKNLELICTGMKITFDSLKILADTKIMAQLQLSKNVMVQGRGILAAIDKAGYPATDAYRKAMIDMVFNAQYSDLLTAPTLDKYRTFIADWPSSEVLPSVKQNYDDALFAESERSKNHDLYLMDNVLPNDTKKHLVPDDWSLYGDKFALTSEYEQATIMYNKAINLGSKEGLFKLTVLKHEGKIKSDEDELIVFQKLAAVGDLRAKEYVKNIQNRDIQLAVEGRLNGLISAKDRNRIIQMNVSGPIDSKDLTVLREMATKGKLSVLNLENAKLSKLADAEFKGCSQLISLKLPTTIRSMGNEALADCSSLTEFALPDSLEEIMGSALNNCSALTTLNIPATLVRGLGYITFCSGCSKLSQFVVDENNPVYSSLDGVLYNKDKTIIIRYPSGKKASLFSSPNTVVEIGNGAFEQCVSLSNIILTESLKVVRNFAFRGCTALTALIVPSMVNEMGSSCFEDCYSLISLGLPMFITEINNAMFKNCRSLSQVTLPETVREIRSNAFSGCVSINSVVLGQNIKGLGDNAFMGCSGLKDLTVGWLTPLNIPALFTGVDLNSCTLHVPATTKPIYQQYPVWKDFHNIVENL
jgi:hypothetical protein